MLHGPRVRSHRSTLPLPPLRSDPLAQSHCDAFWKWLRDAKVNSSRNTIVRAVAEKVNLWAPGIFVDTELIMDEAD